MAGSQSAAAVSQKARQTNTLNIKEADFHEGGTPRPSPEVMEEVEKFIAESRSGEADSGGPRARSAHLLGSGHTSTPPSDRITHAQIPFTVLHSKTSLDECSLRGSLPSWTDGFSNHHISLDLHYLIFSNSRMVFYACDFCISQLIYKFF